MKMVVGRVAVVIVVAFNGACGPSGNAGAGGSGGSGGGDSFTGDSGVDCNSIPRVELVVSSPLPVELDSDCTWGDVTELDALLTLSKNDPCGDTFNCQLTVNASGVSGSCPKIPSDENYTVDLTYRVYRASVPRPVAMQSKYVQLPATSPSVVNLSFAGEALESFFQQNLTDWCDGALL